MEKVKIGVIGCGYMAQMAHLPCLKSNAQAEVTVLCDFREKVTEQLCRKWDIPAAWVTLPDTTTSLKYFN